jgi:hypothetical protein
MPRRHVQLQPEQARHVFTSRRSRKMALESHGKKPENTVRVCTRGDGLFEHRGVRQQHCPKIDMDKWVLSRS